MGLVTPLGYLIAIYARVMPVPLLIFFFLKPPHLVFIVKGHERLFQTIFISCGWEIILGSQSGQLKCGESILPRTLQYAEVQVEFLFPCL